MKNQLKLTFQDVLGKKATLTIDNPKDSLDDMAISAAMDRILQSGVFVTTAGLYETKVSAVKVTTQETPVIL